MKKYKRIPVIKSEITQEGVEFYFNKVIELLDNEMLFSINDILIEIYSKNNLEIEYAVFNEFKERVENFGILRNLILKKGDWFELKPKGIDFKASRKTLKKFEHKQKFKIDRLQLVGLIVMIILGSWGVFQDIRNEKLELKNEMFLHDLNSIKSKLKSVENNGNNDVEE